MNNLFFPVSLLPVQLSHLYTVTGNTRVWGIWAWVSNDTSLLLVIFPNCSTAALLGLSLLWVWLQSPLTFPLCPVQIPDPQNVGRDNNKLSVKLLSLGLCVMRASINDNTEEGDMYKWQGSLLTQPTPFKTVATFSALQASPPWPS